MAWTQSDIDDLKAKILTLEQEVRYADKGVKYQPLENALQLLKVMEAEVGSSSSTATSCGRSTFASFCSE